jgi:hypothetical protein
VLVDFVSDAVILAIMPFRNAYEFWTKIQDKYDMYNKFEDDCISSTSGHHELSSTSPKCSKTQGNSMVIGVGNYNVDSELMCDDHSSLCHCHASSLDLNISSTINALHACVDSPYISCVCSLNTSHNDMLTSSCCHDINASSLLLVTSLLTFIWSTRVIQNHEVCSSVWSDNLCPLLFQFPNIS